MKLRKCDPQGCGHYGASRGTRKHNGVDVLREPGITLYSPVVGVVTKLGYTYSVSQADCDYVRFKGNSIVDNCIPGWQFVYARKGWRFYTGFYYYVGNGEYRIAFKLIPGEPSRVRRIGMTFIVNPFKRWNQ